MPKPSKMTVLFIGNSFTARNNLPELVAQLAKSSGRTLEHRLVSAGGASLKRHWNAGEAAREIASGKYDQVVLQEQSTLPVKNAQRMHESVRLFDAAIRAAKARTVLYMTWARSHAPESQQAITDAYTEIGTELSTAVIPAGEAWRLFLRQHQTPVLHDRDGSHPTMAGSFLAACAAFAVLFGTSPRGIPVKVNGLTGDDVELLQQTAAEAIALTRPSSRVTKRSTNV